MKTIEMAEGDTEGELESKRENEKWKEVEREVRANRNLCTNQVSQRSLSVGLKLKLSWQLNPDIVVETVALAIVLRSEKATIQICEDQCPWKRGAHEGYAIIKLKNKPHLSKIRRIGTFFKK